ncbi:zinc finger, CCHC-type containing protein [Tanacetum coccineum]
MHPGKSQSEHIDEFHKLVGDLAAIDTAISYEDQAFLLLTSLSSSYDKFVKTLLYGRDTLKLEDVLATLNSRELQKMTEAKGDGGEGLYVRGRSGQRDMEQGTNSAWLKSHGRSSRLGDKDQVSGSGADGYDSADVMMAMSVEELLDWIMDSGGSYHITYRRDYLVDFEEYDGGNILLGDGRECRVRGDMYVSELRRNLISLGTLEKEGFTVKMQSGKIKVIKGSLVVLSGTRRANCVYTLDGQAVTRNTLKGRKQLGEYQIGWKIKTGNVLDSRNQRSTQQCMKSGVAKHLGVAGIQQQNGLVNETNVTLFAKRLKTPIDMLGFFGWLASKRQGMLEPVKVKCIFLGYHKGIVGNKLWRFDDVTSKVVLYRNMGFNESGEYKKTFIGSGVGTGSMQALQGDEFEVEPLDGHTFEGATLSMGTIQYREDSNEAAFAVSTVEKNYAHESLIFNDTVAYEVISKWKAGLKDDMDARSDVIHNEKLVQTLLKGHSILSLEGSLLGDCDVEKNGKWSCIYAVGSQEYQMVCTRLDIASADVGMLDKFDHGLQTDVQVFVDFDYAMESGYELSLVAVIAIGALVKGGSRSEVPAQVEGAAYRAIIYGMAYLSGKSIVHEKIKPSNIMIKVDGHTLTPKVFGLEQSCRMLEDNDANLRWDMRDLGVTLLSCIAPDTEFIELKSEDKDRLISRKLAKLFTTYPEAYDITLSIAPEVVIHRLAPIHFLLEMAHTPNFSCQCK